MVVRSRHKEPAIAANSAARAKVKKPSGDTILDPIITMNAAGDIHSASESIEQVFGWTPTELFGTNIKALVPEPRRIALERFLDRYRLAAPTKTFQRTRRFDAVRKDGKRIQVELTISLADLPAYAAPFFVGILRDVSQQTGVTASTAQDRSRLQQLVTEQTRALATANLRVHLADRLASLGTLAAGLGHDMNNVLLPVRARLNALEHEGISAAALEHVKAVRRCISYLQHLSDGLYFFSLDPDSPDAAADDVCTTDINKWWLQVGALLSKAIPRHVKLEASLPATLPAIHIAPARLTQAILSLIVNAGEAIPLRRHRGLVRIWACLADDGRSVRLAVTDNGRGMTPAIRRRAFDPYFTTKSRSMGTGLGLPLACKVTRRTGGDVELKSEVGKGTTAILILPLAPRKDTKAGSPEHTPLSAAISLRDVRTASLAAQILIAAGVLVKATSNDSPGPTDLWVTEPSKKSLAAARIWRARHPWRTVVLVGPPSKPSQKHWRLIDAVIIDPPDDFEAIRHALGQASIRKFTSSQ